MRRIFFILSFYFLTIGCSSNSNNLDNSQQNSIQNINVESEDLNETLSSFPDDTYTATVDYFNSNTGTSSTYTLDVEVEGNSVKVIHFNNGGWLDETHIVSGGQLDENGNTEIESDKGYIYTVTIDQ